MANPGPPQAPPADPQPGDDPARPRPLGPDEPSAPVDDPPDAPRPGIGPDAPPGDPSGPDIRA